MRKLKKHITRTHNTALALAAMAAALLISGSHNPTALERVQRTGELTILSRNGPTTYYEAPHGLDGFEYSLAKEFADYLDVDLAIIEVEHLGSLLNRVDGRQAQMGAAGLTVTSQREKKVRFTHPYMEVTQQLIYRAGMAKPSTAAELVGKTILVISDSAHVETLLRLQQDNPQLRWHEQSNLEMIELIEMVHNGSIDFTIVDSNAFELNRNLYPMARVAFDISEPEPLAWAFPKSVDESLYKLANEFLVDATQSGLIDRIREQHFGKLNILDSGGALTFARRLETRLPQWEEHMRKAGAENDLDWNLLAAISYQESHWDPDARSATGVRGLMMLTLPAAKEVGVKNRRDPEQSIFGGARYFRMIYDRLPAGVVGKDREFMALAAYNVGFGHLEDARVLTQRQGGDPNRWEDVEQRLPLLAKRKYYSTLKHGYARGWEPVDYVRNIRSFRNTIAWHEQIRQSRFASSRQAELGGNAEPPDNNEQAQTDPPPAAVL